VTLAQARRRAGRVPAQARGGARQQERTVPGLLVGLGTRLRGWAVPVALALGLGAAPAHAQVPEVVKVPSLDTGAGQTALLLDGYWYAAQSGGPAAAPAVLMLHGCSGALTASGKPSQRFEAMAQHLTRQGYGVLLLDSFTARGARSICGTPLARRTIDMAHRVRDAHGAWRYLAQRPDVQARHIGLMGFSHGAMTVLNTVDRHFPDSPRLGAGMAAPTFAGAVAFYPGCVNVVRRKPAFSTEVPLLILMGEKDDWTFPDYCQTLTRKAREAGQPVSLVLYPDAYHGFDMTTPVRVRKDVIRGRNPEGVHVGGNAPARQDAYRQVDAFFKQVFQ
jgi:dienelactone hydrolase